tara:strand:- start:565 stop:2055 length:1491 start_codon:yes stop_codon:yes gene_type:complete
MPDVYAQTRDKYKDLFARQKKEREAAMVNRHGGGSLMDSNRSWLGDQAKKPAQPQQKPTTPEDIFTKPATAPQAPFVVDPLNKPQKQAQPQQQAPVGQNFTRGGVPIPQYKAPPPPPKPMTHGSRGRTSDGPESAYIPGSKSQYQPPSDAGKTNNQLVNQQAEPQWTRGGKVGPMDPYSNRGRSIRGAREGYSPIVESVNGKAQITGWKPMAQVEAEVNKWKTPDNIGNSAYAPGFSQINDAHFNRAQTLANSGVNMVPGGRSQLEREAYLNAKRDQRTGNVSPGRVQELGFDTSYTGGHYDVSPFGAEVGKPMENPFQNMSAPQGDTVNLPGREVPLLPQQPAAPASPEVAQQPGGRQPIDGGPRDLMAGLPIVQPAQPEEYSIEAAEALPTPQSGKQLYAQRREQDQMRTLRRLDDHKGIADAIGGMNENDAARDELYPEGPEAYAYDPFEGEPTEEMPDPFEGMDQAAAEEEEFWRQRALEYQRQQEAMQNYG